MTGRAIALLVALAFSILLAAPLDVEAQQAGKVYRIASAIAPSSDAVPSGGLSNRPPEDLGAVIA